MKRLIIFPAIVLIALSVPAGPGAAEEVPGQLVLTKECVLIGRIADHGLNQILEGQISEPVYDPQPVRIVAYDLLNTSTGEWHPLSLSAEGYFCVNLGKGQYQLLARDRVYRPLVVHTFSVPAGMMVNIGTYRMEACDPRAVGAERWFSYLGDSFSGPAHFIRVTGEQSYDSCVQWFSQCHERAYEEFSDVIARR